MARDRNTYAKRQRETGKKQKAAEKRARRQKKKDYPDSGGGVPSETPPDVAAEVSDVVDP
jgi:hypothetical protein